eukprot:GILJ01007478.1.p1 GENE.GILJ01007478.1~~GILJ01007478.1.p1  ORF type:complete len:523 (-),score=66.35 GILJ01007478.1:171-1739(-)
MGNSLSIAMTVLRLPFIVLDDSLTLVRHSLGLSKPNIYLEQNFAPVKRELESDIVDVQGEIPQDIDGMYCRNGPNPQFPPNGPHHWFDGDGMVHGVRVANGTAQYVNKYIKTEKYMLENAAKKPLYGGLSNFARPLPFISYMLNTVWTVIKYKAAGRKKRFFPTTTNTALRFFNGRLLALMEAWLPYQLQVPSLETVGEYDFNGQLRHPMTAHPKLDPKTGELFFFGARIEKPEVLYSVVSADGKLLSTVSIRLEVPVLMHDFAMTEKYIIVMDLPLTARIERLLKGEPLFAFEQDRPSRFGVLPKYAKSDSEIKWFESGSCYVFHTLNAYEEEVTQEDGSKSIVVVLYGCRAARTDAFFSSVAGGVDEDYTPRLYRWGFNMSTGEVTEEEISPFYAEFPTINENLMGRRNRYAYAAWMSDRIELASKGILKFDLQTNSVTKLEYGENLSGGEAVFVSRVGAQDEDDGYLAGFVYDKTKDTSCFYLVDAKTMATVCRAWLPQRVPYGFHGTWVGAEQIANQQ